MGNEVTDCCRCQAAQSRSADRIMMDSSSQEATNMLTEYARLNTMKDRICLNQSTLISNDGIKLKVTRNSTGSRPLYRLEKMRKGNSLSPRRSEPIRTPLPNSMSFKKSNALIKQDMQ